MRFVSGIFSVLLFAAAAQAQMTCSSRPISPLSVRAEGYTELVADLTIVCTGGAPTTAFALVPTGDITITLNVPITNRKNQADNFVDALLLADEPHSITNPNTPLTLCGASGVDCNITGTGTGAGVYSGASNRPNVFQGELTGANTVRFRMPIDPPGNSGQRIFRIVNLRGDATRKAGQTPNTITATASIPGTAGVPETILGIVHSGLTLANPALSGIADIAFRKLSSCQAKNMEWAADPEGATAPQAEASYTVQLWEGSQGSWRSRNIGLTLASGRHGGAVTAATPNVNQNITGYPFRTETGFFNGAAADPGSPVPAIPATVRFEAVRSADRAGAADFGTRFFVRFSNIPQGLDIYLPIETALLSERARTGSAVMVQGDGQTSLQRVAGGARYGLAKMPRAGDTATVFYEVVSSDPLVLESVSIPVYLVTAGTPGGPAPVRLTAGLAPSIGISGPDATAVLPRFDGSTVSNDAFYFSGQGCDGVDLSASATNLGVSGSSGSFSVAVYNTGRLSSSGLITLRVSLPPELTATSIAGADWTCTLATLTCTTSAALAQWSYRDLTVQYTASPSIPDRLQVGLTVSGGGDAYPSDNSFPSILTMRPQAAETFIWFGANPPGLVYTLNGQYQAGRSLLPVRVGDVVQIGSIASQLTPTGGDAAFASWQDGGAMNHAYTVPAGLGLVSVFLAQFRVSPEPVSCKLLGGPSGGMMRSEGLAELLQGASLYCTGGSPTPAGQPIAPVDLRLTFNAPVTSRTVSPGFLETLLLIDNPHSLQNPNVPLLPCGAAGSNDDGTGQCAVTAAGGATYDGAAGHPNVFQGRLEGAATILWKGVPLDPPGPGRERILRIVNLRLNMASPQGVLGLKTIAAAVTLTPSRTGYPSVPGTSFWGENQGLLGIAAGRLSAQGPTMLQLGLQGCLATNPQIFADPSKPLDTGGQNGMQFYGTVQEAFWNAFQAKSWSVQSANVGMTSPAYPADVRQDILDLFQGLETEFFVGTAALPSPYPPYPSNATLPPAGSSFPAVRGLDLAGKVTSGARLYLRVTGIPNGVKLFVPVKLDTSSFGNFRPAAWLVSADPATGAGPFVPISGNASGLAPLNPIGTEAMAVYEILTSRPVDVESLTYRMAVAYAAREGTPATRMRVTAGFAPFGGSAGSDATSPVPRFVTPPDGEVFLGAIDIFGCGLVLDKSSLTFSAPTGQEPPAQTVAVSNLSNSTFTWTASGNSSWISLSPTSGSGSSSISVRALPNGLAPGTYDGSFSVASPGSVTQTVAVRLVVGSVTPTPSYAGWVDQTGCSIISGWAADRNKLNTSISVDILDGSTLIGAVLADGFRGDVATYLGDNGAHAFNWVTPTALKDGRDHTITIRPSGSTTTLGGAQNLRCTAP